MLATNDPFRVLDQWLSGLASAPLSSGSAAPLDAYRRGENVWLHLDLPGVAADSIDVDVERSNLTVTAERSRQRQDGDQVYASERRMGAIRRQFHLGEGLDVSGIEADYHDGVLTLRIPVAERAKPRKITINAARSELDESAVSVEPASAPEASTEYTSEQD